MKRLKCPECGNVVEVEEREKPVCDSCGFGGKKKSKAEIQQSGKGMFEFKGKGLSFFWLLLWTSFLTSITIGIFFPWAYCARLRWGAKNLYYNGKRMQFKGDGLDLLGQWLLMLLLIIITLGIYTPWAYCRIMRWTAEHTSFEE
ncbi:MAG: DUF898 family protein [Candidatus Thermoplasmatota archaeon]|nr:DUF898 family protein [Candidatus Thermoplasmatota archaeon]